MRFTSVRASAFTVGLQLRVHPCVGSWGIQWLTLRVCVCEKLSWPPEEHMLWGRGVGWGLAGWRFVLEYDCIYLPGPRSSGLFFFFSGREEEEDLVTGEGGANSPRFRLWQRGDCGLGTSLV